MTEMDRDRKGAQLGWRGGVFKKGGTAHNATTSNGVVRRPSRLEAGAGLAVEQTITRRWTYDGSLADSGWKVKETGAGVWGCDAGYMSGWQEELRRRVANCFPSTPSSTFARSSEEPVSAGLAFWAGAG